MPDNSFVMAKGLAQSFLLSRLKFLKKARGLFDMTHTTLHVVVLFQYCFGGKNELS